MRYVLNVILVINNIFLVLAVSILMLLGANATLASQNNPTDQDGDGVVDHMDRCPNTQSLRQIDAKLRIAAVFERERLLGPVAVKVDHQGCAPDTDGDGVVDHMDFCPEDQPVELLAGVEANGCPRQSDWDGTPDYRDNCPGTPRGVPTDRFGCPIQLGMD